jgi:hypothetical protein
MLPLHQQRSRMRCLGIVRDDRTRGRRRFHITTDGVRMQGARVHRASSMDIFDLISTARYQLWIRTCLWACERRQLSLCTCIVAGAASQRRLQMQHVQGHHMRKHCINESSDGLQTSWMLVFVYGTHWGKPSRFHGPCSAGTRRHRNGHHSNRAIRSTVVCVCPATSPGGAAGAPRSSDQTPRATLVSGSVCSSRCATRLFKSLIIHAFPLVDRDVFACFPWTWTCSVVSSAIRAATQAQSHSGH